MAVFDNLNLVSSMVTYDADDVSDVVSSMNDGGVLTWSDGACVCDDGAWADTSHRMLPNRLIPSTHPSYFEHHAMHYWSVWPEKGPSYWPVLLTDEFASDSAADVCGIDDLDLIVAGPKRVYELPRDVHWLAVDEHNAECRRIAVVYFGPTFVGRESAVVRLLVAGTVAKWRDLKHVRRTLCCAAAADFVYCRP